MKKGKRTANCQQHLRRRQPARHHPHHQECYRLRHRDLQPRDPFLQVEIEGGHLSGHSTVSARVQNEKSAKETTLTEQSRLCGDHDTEMLGRGYEQWERVGVCATTC